MILQSTREEVWAEVTLKEFGIFISNFILISHIYERGVHTLIFYLLKRTVKEALFTKIAQSNLLVDIRK